MKAIALSVALSIPLLGSLALVLGGSAFAAIETGSRLRFRRWLQSHNHT